MALLQMAVLAPVFLHAAEHLHHAARLAVLALGGCTAPTSPTCDMQLLRGALVGPLTRVGTFCTFHRLSSHAHTHRERVELGPALPAYPWSAPLPKHHSE